MVSLVKLSEVTEDGVKFQSPHDQSEMLLTPEKSIEIQNIIGKKYMSCQIIARLEQDVYLNMIVCKIVSFIFKTSVICVPLACSTNGYTSLSSSHLTLTSSFPLSVR